MNSSSPLSMALGIDVGGVIIARNETGDDDTSFFGDDYLATPPVRDAFATIARLTAEVFFERVFVVSKCGPAIEQRTREWLAHHDFFTHTGIAPDRLHFCRSRAEKAPIAQALGLTHFIDDRLDVLGHLHRVGIPHLFLLNPSPTDAATAAQMPFISLAANWPDILSLLTPPHPSQP